MKKKLVIFILIIIILLIGIRVYKEISRDHTYDSFSFVPEKRKDIPMFSGLKPSDSYYTINGDHVDEIKAFYLKELPKHEWELKQDVPNSDGDGFLLVYDKANFNGDLEIVSYYREDEKFTKVAFYNNNKNFEESN